MRTVPRAAGLLLKILPRTQRSARSARIDAGSPAVGRPRHMPGVYTISLSERYMVLLTSCCTSSWLIHTTSKLVRGRFTFLNLKMACVSSLGQPALERSSAALCSRYWRRGSEVAIQKAPRRLKLKAGWVGGGSEGASFPRASSTSGLG